MGKQVNRKKPTQKNQTGLTDDAVEYVIPKGAKSSTDAKRKTKHGLEQEFESIDKEKSINSSSRNNIDRMAEIMRQTRMEENRKREASNSSAVSSAPKSMGMTGDKPRVRGAAKEQGVQYTKANAGDKPSVRGESKQPKSKSIGLPEQYEIATESQELPPELEAQIAQNIEKRKKKRNRPSPFKLACITIVAAIVLLLFMRSGFFTVDTLRVEGNSYFTDEEIINMGHATTGKNLFFHSGSREIVQYLESSPYIESAKVSKRAPGILIIKVKEREQMAALAYNKEYLIIDADGLLLRRSTTKPKVTILSGIKLTKMTLGEPIEVDNEQRLRDALNILKAMKEGDLYFKKIVFTKKTTKAYVYDALVCKGDAETLISSMEKERLQKILETLFDKGIKRGTITFTKDGYASFEPTV